MKNAFICNSVPSCDIFLHAHAEKSNPTVFCLSGFFFFAAFPFFCCFCLFAAVAICLLGFQSVQEFFQERIIRKFLPSGEEGKLSSKFFTRVSNCFCRYIFEGQSLCLGIIVWFLFLQELFHYYKGCPFHVNAG